jgi:hypothetical protein
MRFPLPRRFPSAADAVANMRKAAGGGLKEFMNRVSEPDRETAWTKIEEKFRLFEGPNGFEVPGEVLIGVGTK